MEKYEDIFNQSQIDYFIDDNLDYYQLNIDQANNKVILNAVITDVCEQEQKYELGEIEEIIYVEPLEAMPVCKPYFLAENQINFQEEISEFIEEKKKKNKEKKKNKKEISDADLDNAIQEMKLIDDKKSEERVKELESFLLNLEYFSKNLLENNTDKKRLFTSQMNKFFSKSIKNEFEVVRAIRFISDKKLDINVYTTRFIKEFSKFLTNDIDINIYKIYITLVMKKREDFQDEIKKLISIYNDVPEIKSKIAKINEIKHIIEKKIDIYESLEEDSSQEESYKKTREDIYEDLENLMVEYNDNQNQELFPVSLIEAIENHYNEVVIFYFLCGVDINYETDNLPLIYYAFEYNNIEIFELLINLNANINFEICDKKFINYVTQKKEFLALLNKEQIELSTEILNVNKHHNGKALIHFATEFHDMNLVRHLVEKLHSNINLYDLYGETPLVISIFHPGDEMLELLLELGANINVPQLQYIDNFVIAPIILAATEGQIGKVELLLNAGAIFSQEQIDYLKKDLNKNFKNAEVIVLRSSAKYKINTKEYLENVIDKEQFSKEQARIFELLDIKKHIIELMEKRLLELSHIKEDVQQDLTKWLEDMEQAVQSKSNFQKIKEIKKDIKKFTFAEFKQIITYINEKNLGVNSLTTPILHEFYKFIVQDIGSKDFINYFELIIKNDIEFSEEVKKLIDIYGKFDSSKKEACKVEISNLIKKISNKPNEKLIIKGVLGQFLVNIGALEPPVGKMVAYKQKSYDIYDAIKNGDVELVKTLIREGIDINTANSEGNSPIMAAILHNKAPIFILLLNKDAYFNQDTICKLTNHFNELNNGNDHRIERALIDKMQKKLDESLAQSQKNEKILLDESVSKLKYHKDDDQDDNNNGGGDNKSISSYSYSSISSISTARTDTSSSSRSRGGSGSDKDSELLEDVRVESSFAIDIGQVHILERSVNFALDLKSLYQNPSLSKLANAQYDIEGLANIIFSGQKFYYVADFVSFKDNFDKGKYASGAYYLTQGVVKNIAHYELSNSLSIASQGYEMVSNAYNLEFTKAAFAFTNMVLLYTSSMEMILAINMVNTISKLLIEQNIDAVRLEEPILSGLPAIEAS